MQGLKQRMRQSQSHRTAAIKMHLHRARGFLLTKKSRHVAFSRISNLQATRPPPNAKISRLALAYMAYPG